MVVSTDGTETLAQNSTDIGDALHTGRKPLSERQARRRGQDAMNDTAKTLAEVLQELAA